MSETPSLAQKECQNKLGLIKMYLDTDQQQDECEGLSDKATYLPMREKLSLDNHEFISVCRSCVRTGKTYK